MYGIIPAPSDPGQWSSWREQLHQWRVATRQLLSYDGTRYDLPEFAWVPSAYTCYFLMWCDQLFYNSQQGMYTIEAFLERGEQRFGGYDSILLWNTYPRIGFDDRNQFDFFRDLPGGLDGARDVVRRCHARGVRVYLPYKPWDTGTRREGKSDTDAIADLVAATEADGIFLDTIAQGPAELRARLDQVRPGLVLNPERLATIETLHIHHMSWSQRQVDSPVPGVLRNKWLERRHMQYQTMRWQPDHTGELHAAWMNGSGIMVWENVCGSWVGHDARYGSILRSMLPVQRRYVDLFAGEDWTPLVPAAAPEVYASLWEGRGLRLWTLVNRREEPVDGVLLQVPHIQGLAYYDLIAGCPVEPLIRDGAASLRGALRARGVGGFIAGSPETLGEDFPAFLAAQAEIDARADWDPTPPVLEERLRPVEPTRKRAGQDVPQGMVAITPPNSLELEVYYRTRECGFYSLTGETERLDLSPGGKHRRNAQVTLNREVTLRPYAIDLAPVTNAQYAEFLAASGYQPRHPENFLKHWKTGRPPSGKEDHPVVYVDLDDARAYARWAGKRLPTEEEWQYAAQGPQRRVYPWGDAMEEGRCNSGLSGTTTSVTAYPQGRSPFGCYDMCGNTWEWIEGERNDGRMRFCILKGGSYYQALGSEWYTDGGPRPANWGAKMLLTWPGMDRCATIGFRCAVDLGED